MSNEFTRFLQYSRGRKDFRLFFERWRLSKIGAMANTLPVFLFDNNKSVNPWLVCFFSYRCARLASNSMLYLFFNNHPGKVVIRNCHCFACCQSICRLLASVADHSLARRFQGREWKNRVAVTVAGMEDESSAASASSSSGARLLSSIALNDNKAGMEGLDRDKINKIILEASKVCAAIYLLNFNMWGWPMPWTLSFFKHAKIIIIFRFMNVYG